MKDIQFRLLSSSGPVINHITYMKLFRLGSINDLADSIEGGLDVFYYTRADGEFKVNNYLRGYK